MLPTTSCNQSIAPYYSNDSSCVNVPSFISNQMRPQRLRCASFCRLLYLGRKQSGSILSPGTCMGCVRRARIKLRMCKNQQCMKFAVYCSKILSIPNPNSNSFVAILCKLSVADFLHFSFYYCHRKDRVSK